MADLKIKLIGIGDVGCDFIDSVKREQLPAVEYWGVSDCTALLKTRHKKKSHGDNIEVANYAYYKKLVKKNKKQITDVVKDADILILVAGLDRRMGSAATPYIADIARDNKILTLTLIYSPFVRNTYNRCLKEIKEKSDTTVFIPCEDIKAVHQGFAYDSFKRKLDSIPKNADFNEFEEVLSLTCDLDAALRKLLRYHADIFYKIKNGGKSTIKNLPHTQAIEDCFKRHNEPYEYLKCTWFCGSDGCVNGVFKTSKISSLKQRIDDAYKQSPLTKGNKIIVDNETWIKPLNDIKNDLDDNLAKFKQVIEEFDKIISTI